MHNSWTAALFIAILALVPFVPADSRGSDAAIDFEQDVKELGIRVEHLANPKSSADPDELHYDDVFSIEVRGSEGAGMYIRFRIGDSWIFAADEISSWIQVDKAQAGAMPADLRSQLAEGQRLGGNQVLYLLSECLLTNMGESIRIGRDVFERRSTRFVIGKNAFTSSP